MRELAEKILPFLFMIDIRNIVINLGIETPAIKANLISLVERDLNVNIGPKFLVRYVSEFLQDYIVEVKHFTTADFEMLGQWYIQYLCIYNQLMLEIDKLHPNDFKQLKTSYNICEANKQVASAEVLDKLFIQFSYQLRINNLNFSLFTLQDIRDLLPEYRTEKFTDILMRCYKKRASEDQSMRLPSEGDSITGQTFRPFKFFKPINSNNSKRKTSHEENSSDNFPK